VLIDGCQHSQVRCPTFTNGVSVGAVLRGIPRFSDKAQLGRFRNKTKNAAIALGEDNLMSPILGTTLLSIFRGLSWQMEGVKQALVLCRHHRIRFGTARNWIRIRTEKATSTTDESQGEIYRR